MKVGCALHQSGALASGENQNVFDPIETLTFVAAQTRNARLGTSAVVLRYHQPIQLARRLATLDALSEGRLEICGGVG